MTALAAATAEIVNAITFLRQFRRGVARFVVDVGDDMRHDETTVTLRLDYPVEPEDVPQLLAQIRREYGLRRGDTIEVINNDGRIDTVRITRKS